MKLFTNRKISVLVGFGLGLLTLFLGISPAYLLIAILAFGLVAYFVMSRNQKSE